MKKAVFSLLTILACLFIVCSALGEEAAVPTLPQAGDQIGGFKVISITPMDALGATGVLFEHEGNGAQLLYLACADPNASFDITFRTPALDDTGKAHVFEHISVNGSERYPGVNLFFPFVNQTYKTYANALTYQNMITYPIASQSEEQLMVMMDYYLAGVFQPLIKTEPRVVDREAWRYELTDAEAPITINGTVYSEMQGTLSSVRRLSQENATANMFRGGATAHISGGRPEAIRTLTQDDLIEFHDTYFHPSNALIILYGRIDYPKFIRYIDEEYISKYARKDVYVERGSVTPYTQTAYAVCQAPVEAAANTENASCLYYDFAYNDMPMDDLLGLKVLCAMLDASASPLQQLAGERLPGIGVSCDIGVNLPAPLLRFEAPLVNEGDRDTFVQMVDEVIEQLAQGIPSDLLDATLSSVKLNLMLSCEDNDLGINASQFIARYWASFGSTGYYADYARVVEEMTAERMAGLVQKYLLGNAYRGVTLTVPAPGMAEENAKALADELAQMKASMSEEEIQAMVEKTQAYAAWSNTAPDPEIVNKFAVMTVDKLPEPAYEGKLTDEVMDGTRYITVTIEAEDVAKMGIYLDASAIPVQKLCDASIAASLLGGVDTSLHSKEELSVLLWRCFGALSCELTQTKSVGADTPDQYAFTVKMQGLGENAAQGSALIEELLFHSEFTDTAYIKSILTQMAGSIRSSINDDSLTVQLNRSRAMFYDCYAVTNYLTGAGMYKRLNELIALADSDPESLSACLKDALALMLNRQNATVVCAGGHEANTAYIKAAAALLEKLPLVQTSPADYSVLRLAKANEALVNNFNVHMNVLVAPIETFSGKSTPIFRLINDMYLVPRLRGEIGAYDVFANDNYKYDYICAYYDPNLAATFEVFNGIPEFLRTVELTQAEVDNYIVGSYNRMLPARGRLTQAFDWAVRRIRGISDETYVRWMQEAKAVTVADVRAMAVRFEAMLENGVRSVSGMESILPEAAELTDRLVRFDESSDALKNP